jgi:succinate-acetate transporter protein
MAISGSQTAGTVPDRSLTGTPMSQSVPTVTGPSSAVEVPLVADPAPLGLVAFGMTTLVLSAINAGWIATAAIPAVLALAIPFGGGGQLLAGMWAFRRGNTFAATAFTSFGAFWISYFLLVQYFLPQIKDAHVLTAVLGTYLIAWGIFTAYMFIASLGGSRAVQVVFALLALTFVALAIGAWTNNPTTVWTTIGGYLGLVTAVAAMYTSFADVTNANFKRKVLPT